MPQIMNLLMLVELEYLGIIQWILQLLVLKYALALVAHESARHYGITSARIRTRILREKHVVIKCA